MSFKVTHDAAAPVADRFYHTSARIIGTADGEVLGPGGSVAFDGPGTHRVLTRHTSGGEVGIRATQLNDFDVDDLTCKEWSGRHFLPSGTPPAIVDGRYDLVGKPAQCDYFDKTLYQGYDSWMAAFVVKRTVDTFVGEASLLNITGTGHRIRPFVLTQDGAVFADGFFSSGAARGRSCPAGTLALNERAVFVVRASAVGWQMFKNGARIDNANIGTGAGVLFSDFGAWASPQMVLGGSTGCVHLERICIMGGLTINQAVKIGIRLNLERQVY
jgi:hypothetical protein